MPDPETQGPPAGNRWLVTITAEAEVIPGPADAGEPAGVEEGQ